MARAAADAVGVDPEGDSGTVWAMVKRIFLASSGANPVWRRTHGLALG
jgi:hypothetical protein